MTCNSVRLKLVKKTSMPNPVNSLGYIKGYSLSSRKLVKSPSNSDTTVKRSAVNQDLNNIPEIRKKTTFLYVIKGFNNHRKKTNRPVVFSCRPVPNVLKYKDPHILKRSASMSEYSGVKFFRTTTGIQSGPDALDESRFLMTFLTILGVTEIRNFRLAPEG